MVKRYREGFVRGFTTNPTLMNKAGIRDYQAFAKEVLAVIVDLPISFEVFADDFAEMERQALLIRGWGPNVNVKIPITNTRAERDRDTNVRDWPEVEPPDQRDAQHREEARIQGRQGRYGDAVATDDEDHVPDVDESDYACDQADGTDGLDGVGRALGRRRADAEEVHPICPCRQPERDQEQSQRKRTDERKIAHEDPPSMR